MAIGQTRRSKRRPTGTISETTTPITTGITQQVAGAAPGVIPSLAGVGQGQLAGAGGTTITGPDPRDIARIGQLDPSVGSTVPLSTVGGGRITQQQALTTVGQPEISPTFGESYSPPPGAAGQAGDMMAPTPIETPIGGVRPDIGFGGGGRGGTRPPAQVEDTTTPTPAAVPTVGELVGTFQEEAEAAKAANLARYEQGLGIHEQLVGEFGAGGTMETAAMQRYGQQKQTDIAAQMQQAVSSGMYGTTRPSTYGTAYEQEVGVPYKLQLADIMAQRKAEAMRGQAGFIERREDIPPDPALMAGMVERAAARPEEEAAPTSLWTSGQTGAVTAEQFSTEAQRQQFSKTYTAQVSAYETQIKQYEDAAKRFDPGSPQQASYTTAIKNLQDLLKTAKENVKEYGEEKAGISSIQYAEEEQRRTAATPTTGAAPSMASVGYGQRATPRIIRYTGSMRPIAG